MKLSEVLNLFHVKIQGQDRTVNKISTDTRTIQAGDVFVALVGDQFDGHDFIPQAIEKGAIALVVSRELKADVPVCRVKDTTQAYGQIANLYRHQCKAKIAGLTGSCGKTTVKEMLYKIFSLQGATTSTQSNDNNTVGVPKTLLNMSSNDAWGIIEMGANSLGEIAACTKVAEPDVALVTMVALQHAEGFGDIETIAREKAGIFDGLKSGGIAVLPRDDQFYSLFAQKTETHPQITFGFHDEADIRAINVQALGTGMSATLVTPQGTRDIKLSLLGRHNIYNAAAAAAVALSMGIPLDTVVQGLANMRAVDKRLCLYRGLNASTLIDDCYNASPASIVAALEILSEFSGKRIWIFGDMGELGAYADQMHQTVGERARDLGIDHIFAVGDKARLTLGAFGQGGEHFPDKETLVAHIRPLLDEHTTVLVKGSRSRRLETVVEALKAN